MVMCPLAKFIPGVAGPPIFSCPVQLNFPGDSGSLTAQAVNFINYYSGFIQLGEDNTVQRRLVLEASGTSETKH